MYSNYQFVKYILKEGDTLKSVAEELNIDVEYLMLTHNLNVEMYDKILSSLEGFPPHLTEVYVRLDVIENYNKKQLQTRTRTPRTIFYRPTKEKLEYGVQFTIHNDQEVTTLKYQTSIQYIERTTDKINYIIEVDRTTTTYFNDEDTSIIVDELAFMVASVLYPLQIIATPQGEWIGIHNYEAITKRWNKVKEELYKKHEGEWTNKYIKLNESTLSDENLLFRSLQKDWFIAASFNSIYTNHTDDYAIERAIQFPVIAQISPLQFTVNQTLNEYLDDNGNVVIEQSGTLTDERNKEDLESDLNVAIYGLMHPEDPKAEGSFDSTYFLDPFTNLIDSIHIISSIALDQPQKIEIVISKIDKN